jgi:hypothetical protein
VNVNDPDFDSSADALWRLYGEKAEHYDKVCVEGLIKNMDNTIWFVRVYLCVHDLKPGPESMLYRPLYYAE